MLLKVKGTFIYKFEWRCLFVFKLPWF